MAAVMVVEDDRDIRQELEEILRDSGYEVQPAEHGRAALDLFAKGARPGVILLDLMMPVMNGFEFLAACRERPECKGTPVIIISADPHVGEVGRVFRVFTKPVRVERLLEAVESALAA